MQSGAWIEQIEIEMKAYCDDETRKPNGIIEQLAEFAKPMGQAHGAYFNIADDMGRIMTEAGFTDVREAKYKLPLGWWSADPKYKEIGKFWERFYKTGLQGWLMQIWTQRMGVSTASVENCDVLTSLVHSRAGQRYMSEGIR
jgi:hypothetical protein